MNKNKYSILYRSLTVFLFLIISGCMKQSLPLYYYTLESSNQPTVSVSDSIPTILVGPIHIASVLDKGQLIRQESPYSVTIEEQHRWAGNLQEMLTDNLINNLSFDLGSNNVYTFPDTHDGSGLQLELTLIHFEKDANGQALTQARWKIIDKTQAIVYSTTSTYTVQPDNDNYRSVVKGLSIGLSRLSKDMANAILNFTPVEG